MAAYIKNTMNVANFRFVVEQFGRPDASKPMLISAKKSENSRTPLLNLFVADAIFIFI
jgi:hypothetical protein